MLTQRRRRTLTALIACAAALHPIANAQVARVAPAASDIDAVFQRYDRRDTPGCSVAVIDRGKVVLKKSYGMADPALGVPMASSTSLWIPYSEARAFVALAVAMLARDGRVGLDDPVRRHVRNLPAYADAVTVRQLLHHTSGLADYGILAGPGFELHDRLSEDELFRSLARWNRLGFEPGRGTMYSNTDYALLKILVERVTGGSLHDYLDGQLMRPLGMKHTRIGFDQARVVPGHAPFHERDGEHYRKVLRYRVSPVGGISVTTSVDDLVRWDRALRDPALGLAALLDTLSEGAAPAQPASDADGHAFGVYRRTHRGLPLVEYRGIGEYTWLVQVPGADLSVATLCNAYAGMEGFAAAVARLYAAPPATASTAPSGPAPAEPGAGTSARERPVAVEVPLAELASHAGEYRADGSSVAVTVALVDGALIITPRGGAAFPPLVPLGGGRFETLLGGRPFRLEFKDEADATALTSWDITADESGGPTLRRRNAWQPTADALRTYPGTYVGDAVDVVLHVRVADGRVWMASRGFAEATLGPLGDADRFRLPEVYTARFERDGSGRVVAVVLDANRVKGMRFARQK